MAIVVSMLRSLADGALFGEQWGQGPPVVVALHGWRRTHRDFAGVLGPSAPGGALASTAPDLPGFGSTAPPPGPWGTDEYAKLVARLIVGSPTGRDTEPAEPAEPAEPVVVVGHSFGGRVAVALAGARPELVRGLVLTAAPLCRRPGAAGRPPAAFRLVRALHRMGMVPESRLERARQRYGSPDYRAAEGVMRQVLVGLLHEDYEPALRSLRCPVELVWGDDDTEVPLAVAEAIEALVPGARLTVCPGAGHLTPLTAPAQLRAAVDHVLRASTP
jgi:pimeloyl-ACP methyl ester carboxylesterase